VSDVQTKSSTISFASNCNMSESFKSCVHILHIDNECCCEGSSTNWRGPVLSGEVTSLVSEVPTFGSISVCYLL
jgi:hypothetical protein